MQVRQYPFHVDPPMSTAMRETLMVAGYVSRAWQSVTRARDQRVRAERAEAQTTVPRESTAFGEILGECGIKVVDFHQAMSSMMDDPASAPTVRNLLGALTGKETAAPDLGARVQDVLTKRGTSRPESGPASPPSRPAAAATASPSPRSAPRVTGNGERPRSPGFRWDLTAAARTGRACPPPGETTASPPLDPKDDTKRAAANDPPTTLDAKTHAAGEAPTAPPKPEPAPPASDCDVKTAAAAETARMESRTSPLHADGPNTERTVPPIEGEAVPTDVAIIHALEALSERSEQLVKRVEALEALVESQAKRLAEAERRLEAALQRLEAREEAARRQAQIQARTEQEVAELRERIARLEAQQANPIEMSTDDPRESEEPANDVARADGASVAPQGEDVTAASEPNPIVAPSPSVKVSRAGAEADGDAEAAEGCETREGAEPTTHDVAKDDTSDPAALVVNDGSEVKEGDESATTKQHVERLTEQLRAAEDRVGRAEDKLSCTEDQIDRANKLADQLEHYEGPGKDD